MTSTRMTLKTTTVLPTSVNFFSPNLLRPHTSVTLSRDNSLLLSSVPSPADSVDSPSQRLSSQRFPASRFQASQRSHPTLLSPVLPPSSPPTSIPPREMLKISGSPVLLVTKISRPSRPWLPISKLSSSQDGCPAGDPRRMPRRTLVSTVVPKLVPRSSTRSTPSASKPLSADPSSKDSPLPSTPTRRPMAGTPSLSPRSHSPPPPSLLGTPLPEPPQPVKPWKRRRRKRRRRKKKLQRWPPSDYEINKLERGLFKSL